MDKKSKIKKSRSFFGYFMSGIVGLFIIGLLAAVSVPRYISIQSSSSTRSMPDTLHLYEPYTRVNLSEFPADETIPEFNTEEYDRIYENLFKSTNQNPLSTFSIDVDTASYSNVRSFIHANQMPPKDAVRIEEMINYFDYNYPRPEGAHPFSIITEISACPWNSQNRLLHIGLQGKTLDYSDIRPSNLVFLIDTSGSMDTNNKLPLLKRSMRLLLNNLNPQDRVAIVAYAGSAGLVLPSTPAHEQKTIRKALRKLNAGGSTAGGEGIELAYKVAVENFIRGGNNRIIMATDGDFNVGISSTSEMVRLIEEKRKAGIFLTICGFGMGNYKDGRMEQISNAGNGNYFYIDNIQEAKKVFVAEMRATLFTIAKDVKIQIEFNPARVKAYRLIGYENRLMASEEFNDDSKDAGELGAGHTVTALYEIVPPASAQDVREADQLKYQRTRVSPEAIAGNELLTIKLRYKAPVENQSTLIELPVADDKVEFARTSENFRFSAAVAGFGMLLRDSQFKGDLNFEQVITLAENAAGSDENGYRTEFISLVKSCALLNG